MYGPEDGSYTYTPPLTHTHGHTHMYIHILTALDDAAFLLMLRHIYISAAAYSVLIVYQHNLQATKVDFPFKMLGSFFTGVNTHFYNLIRKLLFFFFLLFTSLYKHLKPSVG